MPLAYDVVIEPAEQAGLFTVTWRDSETGAEDCFEQRMPEGLEQTLELWRLWVHQVDIGEKLFRFLDGVAGHFKKALDRAEKKDTTLHINLRTCEKTIDWPFECLARDGVFLLQQHLHLVRQVSHCNPSRTASPGTGPLKILFMACSAVNVIPELDFDREEEAIFRITEQLNLDIDIEDSGSTAGLRNRLKNEKYDLIYLSGIAGIDGNHHPYFVMEDEFGFEQRVQPGQLWEEALSENPPRLLFLSGSNTGMSPSGAVHRGRPGNNAGSSFARLMAEYGRVPAVLGWGNLVIDAPVIHAAKMLFRELSRGRSILDAVQRVRHELIKEFPARGHGTWAFLRLYGDGTAMNTMVREHRNWKPGPRRMTHVYLKNSWVRVLGEGFVGRRRQIQACLRALKHDSSKTGVLITGAGGLGKSCLAGKVSERFPNHTLIIVNGRCNSPSLEDALKDAFIVSQDEKAREILELPLGITERLTLLCSSSFKTNHYLLLLDDFEQNLENANKGQPGPLMSEAGELLTVLLQKLPLAGKQTQLIVTCRYDFSLVCNNIDLVEAHLEKIPIPGFSYSENQKKMKVLKSIFNCEDRKLKDFLLDAGCGNPRLLEWLDRLIEVSDDADMSSLLEKVKGKRAEFIEVHVLRELIAYSGEQLPDFLRCLSIYRRPVPMEGIRRITEGTGISVWQPLLKKGVGLSLIEFDPNSRRYMVSALVQDELLPPHGDYSTFHRFAFTYYRELCDGKDNLDARLAEELVYHALGCGEEDTAVLHGARLVSCMHRRLAIRVALNVGEWILSSKKKKTCMEADAFLFNEVAVSAFSLGEYRKALGYYRNALAIDCELYGEEHEETALDLSNMGLALIEIEEYRDAVFCFRKALAINRKIYGPIHAGVAQVLNNLGSVSLLQGKFREALEFFNNALAIDLKVYGDAHQQTAISLNNVGEALKRLGHPGKALDYLLSALAINRKIYGGEHPTVARDLTNIGSAYYLLGKFNTAVEYLEQAYVTFRKLYGRNHIRLTVVLSHLGMVMQELRKYSMALEYIEEALAIHNQVHGEGHQSTGIILNNLGEVWRKKGYPLKASNYYQRGLDIQQKAFGDQHPGIAVGLSNLGLANYDQGYLEEALEYFTRSLAVNERAYGKEHPSIAGNYYNIARVYEEQGKKEKAKAYFKMAYDMYVKFLPEEHPWVTSARQKCDLKMDTK